MTVQPTRFQDGAAYERAMGAWSQIAGRAFLDWVAPAPGLRWVDVGCGNGAFTELVLAQCAPGEVQGVDPSSGQIAYATSRAGTQHAAFQTGDALALPFDDARFDIAVMALVIFFVPDPPAGVAEMIRVVRPGGRITAYAWDIPGGGFPFEPLQAEMRLRGFTPSMPPHWEVSRVEALHALWSDAGLTDIKQRSFEVERHFTDFDDFWSASTAISAMRMTFESMPDDELADIKAGVARRVRIAPDGRVTATGRANAIQGVRS